MIRLLPGDCRAVLATLPADSVHCVVTSPPYYALRNYNVVGQIGLEPTPEAYLAEMVRVFREVRRVLRPDGTCFVNMGDSYASGEIGRHDGGRTYQDTYERKSFGPRQQQRIAGLAPKQLLMMPARLALALQADGWWLRSDIIWHKPNPMPESVTDRPTSAHEHVFLLAKSARYYWDADAVREPQTEGTLERFGNGGAPRKTAVKQGGSDRQCDTWRDPVGVLPNGRNCRNVWTIATAPYSEAHFATFPPALAKRCIRAGTSERGCCAACGAPWGRQTKASGGILGKSWHDHAADAQKGNAGVWVGQPAAEPYQRTTTGWAASCACGADTVPCTVLDPFAGAGTTLLVADRLQRDAIGVELNPAYTEMAMARCRDDAPLFASPPPASDDAYDRDMRDLFAEAAE